MNLFDCFLAAHVSFVGRTELTLEMSHKWIFITLMSVPCWHSASIACRWYIANLWPSVIINYVSWQIVEISHIPTHWLTDCSKKDDMAQCPTCHRVATKIQMASHLKATRCTGAYQIHTFCSQSLTFYLTSLLNYLPLYVIFNAHPLSMQPLRVGLPSVRSATARYRITQRYCSCWLLHAKFCISLNRLGENIWWVLTLVVLKIQGGREDNLKVDSFSLATLNYQ